MIGGINMKKGVFLVCLGVVLFLYSCDDTHYILRKNVYTENETWAVKDRIPFYFTVKDTVKIYKVGFNIRYTNDYQQQNMYVFIHTVFPNGTHTCDTVSIDLFDLEGKPLGKGKRAIELQRYFSLIRFPMSGDYTIIIEQAMRKDTLQGVISMGLSIAEHQPPTAH
jgi:gliding motility-associated lipoprotein GldH